MGEHVESIGPGAVVKYIRCDVFYVQSTNMQNQHTFCVFHLSFPQIVLLYHPVTIRPAVNVFAVESNVAVAVLLLVRIGI